MEKSQKYRILIKVALVSLILLCLLLIYTSVNFSFPFLNAEDSRRDARLTKNYDKACAKSGWEFPPQKYVIDTLQIEGTSCELGCVDKLLNSGLVNSVVLERYSRIYEKPGIYDPETLWTTYNYEMFLAPEGDASCQLFDDWEDRTSVTTWLKGQGRGYNISIVKGMYQKQAPKGQCFGAKVHANVPEVDYLLRRNSISNSETSYKDLVGGTTLLSEFYKMPGEELIGRFRSLSFNSGRKADHRFNFSGIHMIWCPSFKSLIDLVEDIVQKGAE